MNTISNNNISSYINETENAGKKALERVSAGLAINKAADDASGLAIADQLRTQSSSLRQSIDNANSGIAMGNIAQSGINEQEKLLENIKTETLKAITSTTGVEGREAIEKQINKYIDQYEQIAKSTNYNGQQLLKSTGDNALDDISIVAEEEIISLTKSDTTSVSDSLRNYMSDFSSNPNSMESLIEIVDKGIDRLASFSSDWGSASNSMESMVRNSLTAEVNTRNAESVIRDLDFSEGIANFNKSNIQSQVGYLAQSQANAVQSRVVGLLA
ncbi:MAG: flagellin [Campylobacterota bacterium]|nr:flagellin [Campylobacterota bacterium]